MHVNVDVCLPKTKLYSMPNIVKHWPPEAESITQQDNNG